MDSEPFKSEKITIIDRILFIASLPEHWDKPVADDEAIFGKMLTNGLYMSFSNQRDTLMSIRKYIKIVKSVKEYLQRGMGDGGSPTT